MNPAVTVLLAAFVLTAAAASLARADCDSRLKDVEKQAAAITQPRIRQLVDYDLKRARGEAVEGDEDECREALDHAQKLLAPP